MLGSSALAPIAMCVAARPSRARQGAVCALNMWAYLAAYEMPHDDPERLDTRVRVNYPITIDKLLGFGITPTVRLQRTFSAPERTALISAAKAGLSGGNPNAAAERRD